MKKVIVTGTSSGIGKGLYKVFSKNGYQVIGISRTNPDSIKDFIPCDLTDELSVKKTIDCILATHSDFDCIIHCAGDGFGEAIDELEWGKTAQTFSLNSIAPIVITSKLLSLIKKNNADIINIGATIGFKPYNFFSVYGSSKWAMRGWTENLQLELKKTQCRVIGVHPGGVDTAGNDRRRGNIEALSGKDIGGGFMSPYEIAKFIFQLYNLPKGMEVSEVIINRK